MGLFTGMTEEEAIDFEESLIRSIRSFKCGTPFENELCRAVENYHAGRPVDPGVSVKEVILIVHDEWREIGYMQNPDGTGETLYYPRVDIEGGEENIFILSLRDLQGFVPERGHRYRLRVRHFQVIREPDHNRYEFLETLEDTQTGN